MEFSEFCRLIETQPDGVILLEGRRAISPEETSQATKMAGMLAQYFPSLKFRSGGAAGTDQAFADGIAGVDTSRLQIIMPYATHRRNARYPGAQYDTPLSLTPEQEESAALKTITASPKNRGIIEHRKGTGRMAAQAAYLIRDTIKAMGYSEKFPKPLCALFHVNSENPMEGGTGHTIRVCAAEGVPYVFQDQWRTWMEPLEARG